MKIVRYQWLQAVSLMAVAVLAACAGGVSSVTPNGQGAEVVTGQALQVMGDAKGSGQVKITVAIPPKKKNDTADNPAYVSPSTRSMTVKASGQTPQTVNLESKSPGCSTDKKTGDLDCSETFSLTRGSHSLTIILYDEPNGKGDELSMGKGVVKIKPGTVTTVSITFRGVVATATVLLGKSGVSGLNIPQGTPTTVPVTVNAYDAKGNLIIAPGNYSSPIMLTDSDKKAMKLNSNTVKTPGEPITLAYSDSVVSSVTVTPVVNGTPQPGGAATVFVGNGIVEFPIPTASSLPQGIVTGPDGALWFAECAGNKIGRISNAGSITEYSLGSDGSGPSGSTSPTNITVGPDSALWFTESTDNNIGRITTDGRITEFSIPTGLSGPYDITKGADGALWFTEEAANAIGRITTSGSITQYRIPSSDSSPGGIVAGPDGALWFTSLRGGEIGRITTGGSITEHNIPASDHGGEQSITVGPDGALWFTDFTGDSIGRITTSGNITEFSLSKAYPFGITAGPDGALWFTEAGGNAIGRITTTGVITSVSIPTADSFPFAITTGEDGSLWFTGNCSNIIGRVPQSALSSSSSESQRLTSLTGSR